MLAIILQLINLKKDLKNFSKLLINNDFKNDMTDLEYL